MEFKYLLYDSRYYSDPSSAFVYTVSDSLREAKKDQEHFTDGVIVKCEVDGDCLINPEIIEI